MNPMEKGIHGLVLGVILLCCTQELLAQDKLHVSRVGAELALATVPNDQQQLAVVDLPLPDGRTVSFQLQSSEVVPDSWRELFPGLMAWVGYSPTNPGLELRITRGAKGWQFTLYEPAQRYHLSLDSSSLRGRWQSATGVTSAFACLVPEQRLTGVSLRAGATSGMFGDTLRTYRLALAATGEYTIFQGGTIEKTLAAMVDVVNQVNAVYERDLAIRFTLVEATPQLIFLDPATDPYTRGNETQENQRLLDETLGNTAYDLGHVFGAAGASFAVIGVACQEGQKAKGVTALPNPSGDVFAIDFVAHELAHQLGGQHTFNGVSRACSTQRYAPTAYEPGSGTTIMGYAGLCGTDDVAPRSSPYFHLASIAQINQFVTTGPGKTCPVKTPINQAVPEILLPADQWIIPQGTPFSLRGEAIDLEGNPLSYTWEQFDLGPATALGEPNVTGPAFRSVMPAVSPERIFPNLPALVAGQATPAEQLPTQDRTMHFRLSVRDGEAVAWQEVRVAVADYAGPFRVLTPDGSEHWRAGTAAEVRWDPAMTQAPPVACREVGIWLSTDGGATFSLPLARNVPNLGLARVWVPDTLSGNQFRLMIRAEDNIFLAVNDAPFTIDPVTGATFVALADPVRTETCTGEVYFTLRSAGSLAINDPTRWRVLSPEGWNPSWGDTLVAANGILSLRFRESNNTALTGFFTATVIATRGTHTDTVTLRWQRFSSEPIALLPREPAAAGLQVSTLTHFRWDAHPGAAWYTLEVAADSTFQTLVLQAGPQLATEFRPAAGLAPAQRYYWRIRPGNGACALEQAWSGPFTFVTEDHQCSVIEASGLPLAFNPSLPFLRPTLTIPEGKPIRAIQQVEVSGMAADIGNLSGQLRSPEGTLITLLSEQNCTASGDFHWFFSDQGENLATTCQPQPSGSVRPSDPLSSLQGESSQGEWALILRGTNQTGTLDRWALKVCYSAAPNAGIEPQENRAVLHVFPNPGGQEIRVLYPWTTGGRLHLIDALGRPVFDREVAGGDPHQVIHVPPGLTPGVYVWLLVDTRGRRAVTRWGYFP